jgi:murein DD-endopeptidase MepM/ murein hydrolase activator NlpD
MLNYTRCAAGASAVPPDFFVSGGTSENVPVFVVNYGSESQSIFKDVLLDQQEFTETDEGLKIIDDIANKASPTNRTNIGQNLFNLYSVRSYSCEVECMGNAMIQPMMYFQLNNIPMFRGAYWIIKTSHSITPNHMTTKFRGVRIRHEKTPLLDASTVFMNIVGSLDDVKEKTAQLTGVFGGTTLSPTTQDDKYIKDGEMNSDTVKALAAVYPVDTKYKIGSPFGLRGSSSLNPHYGVDIYCVENSSVHAVADGYVYSIKLDKGGYGLRIITKHEPIPGGDKVMCVYAHLNRIDSKILEAAGVTDATKCDEIEGVEKELIKYAIKKGDFIGLSGGGTKTAPKSSNGVSFAGHSEGYHLHFEVRTVTNWGGFFSNAQLRYTSASADGTVDKDGYARQRKDSGEALKATIVNDPVQVIQSETTYNFPTNIMLQPNQAATVTVPTFVPYTPKYNSTFKTLSKD